MTVFRLSNANRKFAQEKVSHTLHYRRLGSALGVVELAPLLRIHVVSGRTGLLGLDIPLVRLGFRIFLMRVALFDRLTHPSGLLVFAFAAFLACMHISFYVRKHARACPRFGGHARVTSGRDGWQDTRHPCPT